MEGKLLMPTVTDYFRKYLTVYLFLIISLLILTSVYLGVRSIENQNSILENNDETQKRVNVIKVQILENLSVLKLIQAYIQKNQAISRSEFSNIVSPIIESNSSIQAIEWIPKVSTHDRSIYESKAIKDGFKDFYFKEFDKKGNSIRAKIHDFYYPVYYLEPLATNEGVFGFDISAYSFSRINLSAVNGFGFAFSSGLKLVQDSTEFGLITYLPVYLNSEKVNKIDFDENNIRGYVAGVYKTSTLIKHSLSEFSEDIAIQIFDRTDSSILAPLYSFIPNEFDEIPDRAITGHKFTSDYYFKTYKISIANFSWEIVFVSNLHDEYWRLSLIILIVGLFIIFLFSTIIFFKQKASREINAINQQLKHELFRKVQYEKELKLSEEKFSKLFFSAPLPISFIRIADRHLIDVNPEFEKKLGYCKSNIIDKTTIDIGLWLNSKEWNDYYKIFLAQREVNYYEVDIKTFSGEIKTYLLSSNLICLQDQDFIYTFYQDITERKKAELDLLSSETKYREVFNLVNDAFFIYDIETEELVDTNKKAKEIFTFEEFKGNNFKGPLLIYKDLIKKYVDSISSEGSVLSGWQVKNKSGNRFWVEIGLKKAIINNKNCILSVVRDVSERKRIEKLFIENEFLIRSQFNNSNLGIAIASTEKEWIRVNKKFCETIGYSEEELLGKIWIEHTYLEDAHKEIPQFNKMLAGEIDGYEIEKRFIKKDGNLIYTHNSVSCFRNPDKTIHYIITYIFDITDRVELENKILKVIIETEESERTRFAQELHDGLGPLLSSIKMYTQWMLKPGANIDQNEALLQIESLANMASESVREIAFGLSPHILKDFGLTEALYSFIAKIKLTQKLTINFNSNLSKRLDEITETIIYRIIIECINNSLKHSQADIININLDETTKYLNIEYNDNGIGFDLHEVTDKKSGMGLYNIQNRLKSINGKLRILSQPGEGTIIKINILL